MPTLNLTTKTMQTSTEQERTNSLSKRVQYAENVHFGILWVNQNAAKILFYLRFQSRLFTK